MSPNARPPLSNGKQPSELDIKQLITGAMRMWIANRELDQVEARNLFNKLNAALRKCVHVHTFAVLLPTLDKRIRSF